MTNDKLLKEAQNGSMDAFASLVGACQPRLYAFVLKMVRSREEAEEIVQETFIRAYKNLWRYDNRASFITWLYAIALNLCKSALKKLKRMPLSLDDAMPGNKASHEAQSMDPSEHLADLEYRKEAHRLMAFLKPDQRACLVLKYMEGLSYAQIGRILRISEEAAKMKVYRAKKEILKRFPGGINHVL